MALDDWTRVSDNVFHAFHVHWISELAAALNDGLLPEGYFARPEESVGTFETDVLTVETGGGGESAGSSAVIRPTAIISPPRLSPRKDRRISVFSAGDERRVSVVEIVSPGNKDSDRRARNFEEKILVCLASGLHVLVVDVLPPTGPAPGFAAAVARELGSASLPEEGRAATSFECQPSPATVRIYHRSMRVGDPLPEVPLFLEPGRHIEIPLETTYSSALRRLPRLDRDRLGESPPSS
ncbi:MAG: DUF4058 family protein [Planctomycetes bacterium]|nr:DUF4058 family protein [Planctomycetota bacterium]